MKDIPSLCNFILPPAETNGKKTQLLVGVSGGADSVALLLFLHKRNFPLLAVHANFHLRGEESDRDERFVRQLCQRHKLTLEVLHFDTRKTARERGISIEMAARDLRYEAFEQLRQQRHLDYICVAHHQQDQVETLLLNLCRGTGLRGLCGMTFRHGDILRPLINCTRKDIEDFLRAMGQDWVTDSSNHERDAMRNIIRLDVLPLLRQVNTKAIENIAGTAHIVQQSLPYYQQGLAQELAQGTPTTPTALHEMLRGCGFTSAQERDIWNAETGRMVESASHRLLKDRGRYILQPKAVSTEHTPIRQRVIPIGELKMLPEGAYFDAALVATPLITRRVEAGDRFIPFGMKGSKLVSDLLTDLKLNRFEKEQQQVVCDAQGHILWVVGRRASNLFRITPTTSLVLELGL